MSAARTNVKNYKVMQQAVNIRNWSRLCITVLIALVTVSSFAGASVEVDGSLVRASNVARGESTQELIVLVNRGSEPAAVHLYLEDYHYELGQNYYYEAGTTERSNAAWIELPGSVVTIPPGERVVVPIRITVPDDPNLSGSYWTVLMVQPLQAEELEVADQQADEITLRIRNVFRYGIQIITNVAGSGTPSLVFENPRVIRDAETNALTFEVSVRNTGDLWINPQLWIDLYGAAGARVGRYEEGRARRLLPGTSVISRITLPAVEAGQYTALLVANDDTSEDVFGVQYRLEVPGR